MEWFVWCCERNYWELNQIVGALLCSYGDTSYTVQLLIACSSYAKNRAGEKLGDFITFHWVTSSLPRQKREEVSQEKDACFSSWSMSSKFSPCKCSALQHLDRRVLRMSNSRMPNEVLTRSNLKPVWTNSYLCLYVMLQYKPFPALFFILQALKLWMMGRPGNVDIW